MTALDDRKPDSVPTSDSEWLYLPGTPWSMRLADGSGGRPALEVYAAGSLLDVVVASSRASRLLRGACAVIIAGQARAIAWGLYRTAGRDITSRARTTAADTAMPRIPAIPSKGPGHLSRPDTKRAFSLTCPIGHWADRLARRWTRKVRTYNCCRFSPYLANGRPLTCGSSGLLTDLASDFLTDLANS